jgi:hypothetical protein
VLGLGGLAVEGTHKMGCDVLNLEWSSSGRDREVASLICCALRDKGYSVVEASIFNFKYYLVKYRPRLLYAADPKGARVNYQAVKFAQRLGIPVVTFTAEGDYTPEKIRLMFWGHISGRRLIERLNLQWSSRKREMVLEIEPSLADRVKVSGAVGFDRYKIYRFRSKQEWMSRYDRNCSHMVGYAGWGFDRFYRNDPFASALEQLYGKQQVEQFREERFKVTDILRRVIEHNRDTLFLLKEHPGVVDSTRSELAGLQDLSNTLYIRDEEAIADCIRGCDIWMAFDSTTCLEAWLLGKPTVLINPFGGDFPRSGIHQGSPIVRTAEELQAVLEACLERGSIPAFDARENERRQIIEETIQWDDGKNHLRAAYLFEKVLLESTKRTNHVTVLDKMAGSLQNAIFEGSRFLPMLPRFRTYVAARRRFQRLELEELAQRYEPYLRSFYQENPLTEADIAELERVNAWSLPMGMPES